MKPTRQPIRHYHRLQVYDYSRGASLFITITTSRRRQLFGRVVDAKMILSAFGLAVAKAIAFRFAQSRDFRLYGCVVMPDHIHFRIYLRVGLDNAAALALINHEIGRLKSFTNHLHHTEFGGAGQLWQEGFHDWLCQSREAIDAVERYIAYNPLKWWLRNELWRKTGERPLELHEPLKSPRLGAGEYWRGIGAVGLLNEPGRQMVALRVSRRCGARDIEELIARLKAKAAELVVISGFISAGERAAFAALSATSAARLIKVSPYALAHDYQPPVAALPAIAEGRYAIIARGNSPDEISRAACLDLNARIVEIADRAAYAKPGEIEWLK